MKDYVRYARVMFEALGSRVPYWITFNEPFCSSGLGYAVGKHAPGRSSDRTVNDEGDSSTEPWLAGHSIMCAHGAAVKMFREEFKPKYGGEIGITLNGKSPFTNTPYAQLLTDFQVTTATPGTPPTPKTSPPSNANSNSQLPGSPTQFTTANTQTACAPNSATASPHSPTRKSHP